MKLGLTNFYQNKLYSLVRNQQEANVGFYICIILGRLKLLKVISVHVIFKGMGLCVLAQFGDRGVLRPISLVGSATYSHVNFFIF